MRKINHTHLFSNQRSGFTLIETLLSLAILSAAVTIFVRQYGAQQDMLNSLNRRLQISSLRTEFTRSVDCVQSLQNFRSATTGVVKCNAQFKLRDKNDQDLLDPAGRLTGADPNWRFQASCGTESIEIKAQLMANNTIVNDVTLGKMDFANTSVNPMMGSKVSFKLCPQMFGLRSRAEAFKVKIAAIGVTSADCANMNNRPLPYYMTETSSPVQKGTNGCADYCSANQFLSGYITYCSSAYAICNCLR